MGRVKREPLANRVMTGVEGGSMVPAGMRVVEFNYVLAARVECEDLLTGVTDVRRIGEAFIVDFENGHKMAISGAVAWELTVGPKGDG